MSENPRYHEIKIPDTGVTHFLPRELMYCDNKQFVLVNELLYEYATGKIDYGTFRIQAVIKLLKLNPKYPKKLNLLDKEAYYSNLYMLSELIDSFFEKNGETQVPKLTYRENPISIIRPMFKTYYGPKDFLMDITFGQYLDALNIYADFVQLKTADLLYMLMAVFYRRKGKKYNGEEILKLGKKFEKYPIGYAYGVFHLFGALQLYLTSGSVFIEGKEIDFSLLYKDIKTKDGVRSKVPGLGMLGVAFSLAETQVFGDFHKVRETKFIPIILQLYELKKRETEESERLSKTPQK